MKQLVVMILLSFLSCACTSTIINPEAFDKDKRYGVILVTGGFDLGDAFRDGTSDGVIPSIVNHKYRGGGYSARQEMLRKTHELLEQELGMAHGIRYVASNAIVGRLSYRDLLGVNPGLGYGISPDYSFFSSMNQHVVSGFIQDNNLDGVIRVHVLYTYRKLQGKYAGAVSMTFQATDKHGEEVWQQGIQADSKGALDDYADLDDRLKISPLLEEAALSAIRNGVRSLDDAVQSRMYGH